MAISNNTTGYRPGVCTSTTRPTAPYEGQMIYETDTDMVALWNGSAWRYIAATTPTNGTVLQVQSTMNNTQTTVTSSTYTTLTNISVSITPKSTSSKVLVTVNVPTYVGTSSANSGAGIRLLRNGSVVFDPNPADSGGPYGMYTTSGGNLATMYNFQYLDSPSTTSAVTYSVQGRGYSASMTVYFNSAGGVQNGSSVITAMEIAG